MLAAAYAVNAVVDVGRAVAQQTHTEDILSGQGGHGEAEVAGVPLVDVAPFAVACVVVLGHHLLQHGAVGIKQFDGGTDERLVGADVLHIAVQLQLPHLLLLVVFHSNMRAPYLHFHGQALADALHGVGCRESRDIGRGTQVTKPVGQDVDGVIRMFAADGLQGFEQRDVAEGLRSYAAYREYTEHRK